MFIEETPEYTIRIGRNAHENDKLLKSAHQDALWFHLTDEPSPHGILETRDGASPDRGVVVYTAYLVKSFSKLKDRVRVPVDILERKYVHRTKTPGLVTLKKTPKRIRV